MKKRYFLGGVVLGALAGAVAGLLVSPASGKENRKKLKHWFDTREELLKNAKDKTEVLVHKAVDGLKEGITKLGIKKETKAKKPPYTSPYTDDSDNSEAAA